MAASLTSILKISRNAKFTTTPRKGRVKVGSNDDGKCSDNSGHDDEHSL